MCYPIYRFLRPNRFVLGCRGPSLWASEGSCTELLLRVPGGTFSEKVCGPKITSPPVPLGSFSRRPRLWTSPDPTSGLDKGVRVEPHAPGHPRTHLPRGLPVPCLSSLGEKRTPERNCDPRWNLEFRSMKWCHWGLFRGITFEVLTTFHTIDNDTVSSGVLNYRSFLLLLNSREYRRYPVLELSPSRNPRVLRRQSTFRRPDLLGEGSTEDVHRPSHRGGVPPPPQRSLDELGGMLYRRSEMSYSLGSLIRRH